MSAPAVYANPQPPVGDLPSLPTSPGQTTTAVGPPLAPQHQGDTLPMTGMSVVWLFAIVLVLGAFAVAATIGARGNR